METSDYPCTFDTECPGLKKCCSSSKGAGCVDPMPEGMLLINSRLLLIEICLIFPSEGGGGRKTVTIALHKTNMGICFGSIPGYSASVLAPVSTEWCVGAVGPADLPWLLILLCWHHWQRHMASEAIADGCTWALHICQVKACFGCSEPSYSSVAFHSIRPQVTWLFYFVRFRKNVLVQCDSACENGF